MSVRKAPDLPPLAGGSVYLRPIMPADYPYLQTLEMSGESAPLWRYRGATASPDQWAQVLWQGVLVQMLVVAEKGDQPLGLVVVYRPEFQDGHAYLAALNFDLRDDSGRFMLGLMMFIRYCFACWPFRRLYMESDEFSYEQFASGEGKWFDVEGRLTEHTFLAGRFWDRLTLTIRREHIEGRLQRVTAAATRERQLVTLKLPSDRV